MMAIRRNQTTISIDYFVKQDILNNIARVYGTERFNTWDEFFDFILAGLKELPSKESEGFEGQK